MPPVGGSITQAEHFAACQRRAVDTAVQARGAIGYEKHLGT
jgi:hypothetical protein